VTEIPLPTVIRRPVALASAVYEGEVTIEGVTARLVTDEAGIAEHWEEGMVPVVVDSEGAIIQQLQPDVVVDAIIAKRNVGTHITDAPVVVALGPGFTVGADCHAVVETNRGHDLGRVLLLGSAEPSTGVPGTIAGHSVQRVLRAPADGVFRGVCAIGNSIQSEQIVAYVDRSPVCSRVDGVLRGLLHDGLWVTTGMKVGDVDPRGVASHCFTISDKALAVGGGVLEAILYLWRDSTRDETRLA
jgi:xanthine dehydrogenase accessory factor